MTRPRHPAGTYVGLFGSHGGGWRRRCAQRLDAAGVPWHDPTDPRWEGITHENGDERQALIDELVAEEHAALAGSRCVVFHFAGGEDPPASLAARFELGFAAGRGIPTFLHVDPAARGRNYLRAAARLYPAVRLCVSLDEAVDGAVAAWRGGG